MSKETEINLSVAVKDGPKTQPQKTTLPKEYCVANVTKAINEELELTLKDAVGKVKFVVDPDQQETLVFVAIHADQYTYKDSCGDDKPGIWYYKHENEGEDKWNCGEFLDGPHVYVSRRLQEIDFKHLHFHACREMFDCIPDKDKKKIVVNVTYGVGKMQSCKKDDECKPCAAPTSTTTHAQPAAVAVG